MAEDRKESDLPYSNFISFIRGISNNKESVNFDIENMYKLLFRGDIGGETQIHANELKHGTYYKNRIDNHDIEQLYPYNDALIIVLYISHGILQIHIHPLTAQITIRTRWGGNWSTISIR